MIYKYKDDTPVFGGSVTVDYHSTGETHVLKLIDFNYRYPAYGIDAIFKNKIVRITRRSKHAIVVRPGFFVLYPYRNGKPFYLKKQGEK